MKWFWKGLEIILTIGGLWMAVDAIIGGFFGTYHAYGRLPVVSFWWVLPAILGLALFFGGLCLIFKVGRKGRGPESD
ncbi:MAG: hypothetical protein AB7E51_12290 [Pseudodesulfovibrio sp.]|uniref:Uncharacterized protein n=1 Tax=Pseudodesulfovibrio indicus TaxID=1716143 RepID=A0A126QJY5_9BACT|nr:hypothetical protein [Pseudodesulfovibrio indicus]AMK10333.1 hypothetical protein AWY79_03975 [Pseudodesulfovibrio indicus]TDT81981.1 hypothetical protein EDC59_11932 [Pseudodesulfovibrio indicus]